MEFWDDLTELRTSAILREMSIQERAVMLKKLLGPLSDPKALTNREASFYFCNIAREASGELLARDFNCTKQRVYEVLSSAENKIKQYSELN